MPLKLALPKGRLQPLLSSWLGGWGLEGYEATSRSYRPSSRLHPQLQLKVFQERDIPIQVAVGNYDLGICGRDWVEELLVRYPQSPLVRVREVGSGGGGLYLASSIFSPLSSASEMAGHPGPLRLVSEYPNLAEAVALRLRLRRFQVFPLWGAAEVYPPETADLVVMASASEDDLRDRGLCPLLPLLPASTCLIAYRPSWEGKDLGEVLAGFPPALQEGALKSGGASTAAGAAFPPGLAVLALPDGHQQPPTLELLRRAGLPADSYSQGERRFLWEGVAVKVLRPQDMPIQVANGNLDLAITGQDWLRDHLCRFPGSPVKEYLALGFGQVKVVAVVGPQTEASSPEELRGAFPVLRVASEYVNLADRYATDKHLGPYRIIPTWGASEAFLPEDADLLIENTQTGRTLARHGLKIIDTLLESSACLIGPRELPPKKRVRVEALVEAFRRGAGG
ncbi:MAG: ATP phosphoribosyltransferase [Chloroflexi bacterium]|nr:ATP phosphoribosyltransferase [Chloroflexota bacterium]